ncbi:hypothetical protein [Methylobacter sp.]|uniref:hypothetical protein n=1 Tax=Methylobacter sp. TaxID=2051955 RepID=UPI0025D90F0B|nr:hypothetical protein [Methylobacter sp.]
MPTQLEVLLDKMKALENELVGELQKQQEEFLKEYSKQLLKYITDAKLKNIITIPFIWGCIIPVALMGITISLY